MPIAFRIKKLDDGRWVPDFDGLETSAYFSDNDNGTPEEPIRESLFAAIDELFPGQYTLERDVAYERDEAFRRIDRRSDALIQEGFPFEGSVFSLTVEAQVRFTNMLMLADVLPYPLTINSLDDRSAVDLQSAAHTQAFCMTALGFVKSVVDSGSVQKNIVREMTDVNEMVAYSDPR